MKRIRNGVFGGELAGIANIRAFQSYYLEFYLLLPFLE